MRTTAPARVPVLQEIHILGLVVTCVNAACRKRRWLEVHALPAGATVASVAANARCRSCGGRGAHVEVIQPVAEIGEQRGLSGPRNIEHAARLKKHIEECPVSPAHPGR